MSRESAAQAVSDTLSDWIAEGDLLPGAKVGEELLAERLGVSRNTVREAFRLLAHDGLLVHQFNRGVFVADLGGADVMDIYRVRRIVQPSVVRRLRPHDTERLSALVAAVEEGEAAVRDGEWVRAGSANMRFHRHLVALAGSPRLDATMRRLMAELRLVFAVIEEPRALHQPFVRRNRELLRLMQAGEFERGADYLDSYLDDSEAFLLDAFIARERTA